MDPRRGILSVYYQNLGGINTSLAEYKLACSDNAYDLYAFSETWLAPHTLSCQLFDDSYEVFRKDRTNLTSTKSCGGGVLLAIRKSLKPRELKVPNTSGVELVWVTLPLTEKSVHICVAYLPPDRVNDPELIELYTVSISWLVSKMKANDSICVLGDFNLSCLKWIPDKDGSLFVDVSRSTITPLTARFLDDHNLANLAQISYIENDNNAQLDLCFVSNDVTEHYKVSHAPTPLVKDVRHHSPLHLSIVDNAPCKFIDSKTDAYYNFKKANYTEMNNFLDNIDWDDLLSTCDVNSAADVFSHVLLYAIDQFVPKKCRKPPVTPEWSTPALERLKASKRSALKSFSKGRSNFYRLQVHNINNRYKHLNKKLFLSHQIRVQKRLKKNPKGFWKYVNKQRSESGLPSSMVRNGVLATNTSEICDAFRAQFSSVFTNNNTSDQEVSIAAAQVPESLPIPPSIIISHEDFKAASAKLKCSHSSGPDGVPAIVLKRCSNSICLPLTKIFNMSLSTGVFPDKWKESFVFPVFKKGCKQDIGNYRGIAALCAMSKLFEVIVLEFFSHYCSSCISDDQHGFLSKRSTNTNLVTYVSTIQRAIQEGYQVDAVYTDLSAAFDKIDHRIAIAKLRRIGLHGTLLEWVGSYLTGRTMQVKIADCLSLPFLVTSGVPQGSHLGPFIFLLYINDVNIQLQCSKLSYADDFKLFAVIKDPSDCHFLQRQIDVFSDWCRLNQMVLNPSKCSTITFTRKRSPVPYNYKLFGNALTRDRCVKDLGVMLDSELSFKDHIAFTTSKASKQLGMIFRMTKYFRDVQCLKTLYCSLVRSTLEYGSIVWAPFYSNEKNRIEAVQRKFTRFALRHSSTEPLDYASRCNFLRLDPLTIRRDLAKAAFVSDLLRFNINCPRLVGQLNINIRRRTLRTHAFLTLPFARTNYAFNEQFWCFI